MLVWCSSRPMEVKAHYFGIRHSPASGRYCHHLDSLASPSASQHWHGDRAVRAGHTQGVDGVSVCADGTTALSWAADKAARCWDLASGQCRATLTHATGITKALLSPSAELVATVTEDFRVIVWDTSSESRLSQLKVCPGSLLQARQLSRQHVSQHRVPDSCPR